ncbi:MULTISPECIES: hypothetical protein [Corynebacterium]|nr:MULTISPECIES: hypothetical protein [Corynebacterium]MDU3197275.1 hypothetical protein [Corynebacterium kroppenstedtii]UWY21534.1 hypothetical protein N2K96_07770 [Corynebacterium kroppenstedtii]
MAIDQDPPEQSVDADHEGAGRVGFLDGTDCRIPFGKNPTI